MMAEHILYTIGILLIVGIYFTRYTGKIYYWRIILIASFIPDLDHLHHIPYDIFKIDMSFNIAPWIEIGQLHNILWLVILSVVLAGLLTRFKKIPFYDGLLFCLMGYGIHLIEDYISYPPVYRMLYPFTSQPVGINLIPETKNLTWAGTEVLSVGIIFLLVSILWYIGSTSTIYNSTIEEE